MSALLDDDLWVIDGMFSRYSTLIYGESGCGKSTLVAALTASLVTGESFLGRSPNRKCSVAICWTDDAGDVEYRRRIGAALPPGLADPTVGFYALPVMQGAAYWQALYERVTADGHDFVVIDNLSQTVNGSINHDEPLREFFGGTRLFVNAGIPVVIVHHSTDKSYQGHKANTPMGHAFITQNVRWRCRVTRPRASNNVTLDFDGNHAQAHRVRVVQTGPGTFDVVGVLDAEQVLAGVERKRRERRERDATRDGTARQAAMWLANDHPATTSAAEASRLLAARFPELSSARNKPRAIAQMFANGTGIARFLTVSASGAALA